LKGWSWNEVMPYFVRSENNTDLRMSGRFHGFDGLLSVSTVEKLQPIHKTMIRAAQELGYRQIDLNDPKESIGVAVQQMTVRFVWKKFF
jgi:choline dehydrogenase-like flavoprotein